jgi:hypothetical protein
VLTYPGERSIEHAHSLVCFDIENTRSGIFLQREKGT